MASPSNTMYAYENIRWVHFEITERCNAACPQCPRNLAGGSVNPRLSMAEVSLEETRVVFPPEFVSQLEFFLLCGNYGDPMVARDTLGVLEYLRRSNEDLDLSMHTNAGARSREWWSELARFFRKRGKVIFSIDGLADTNHLYRRRTNWDRIMENAEAFIEAGGRAAWSYIVFRHNEHQVGKARRLARRMGFVEFSPRLSPRFVDWETGHRITRTSVVDTDGEFEYYLEAPTRRKHRNAALENLAKVRKRHDGFSNYHDETAISCKALKTQGIYVSAESLVFPCCWTGHIYEPGRPPGQREQIWDLIDSSGGKEAISARHYSLKEIVEGPFMRRIADSWNRPSTEDGKLRRCATFCGQEFDPVGQERAPSRWSRLIRLGR